MLVYLIAGNRGIKMLEFKKRKVHEGRNCYLAVLPAEWVRSNKLEKGSIIRVLLDKNGALLIKPAEEGSHGSN